MKKVFIFLKKIVILLILFFLLDYLCGIALKKLFSKQKSGKYFSTLYALQNAKEDVMIFGNSHANEHFNALLMEEKLKLATFNFGNQGQSILYQYPIIKTIIQKKTPKLIILQIEYHSLKYFKIDYEKLSIFFPFRYYNQYVDSAIESVGNYEMIKTKSSLYRYNSTLGYTLLNTYKSSYNKSYQSRGFDPMYGTLCNYKNLLEEDNADNTLQKNIFKIDSLKIKYLNNIIDELQAKKIKFITVLTPHFAPMNIKDNFYFIELKKILSAKNIPILDFAHDSTFVNKCELFHDQDHLNENGAKIFTENIIDKIKPMLNE